MLLTFRSSQYNLYAFLRLKKLYLKSLRYFMWNSALSWFKDKVLYKYNKYCILLIVEVVFQL